MTAFKLEITLGNDAMQMPENVATALQDVIIRLGYGSNRGTILDANGNTVGSYGFE